MINEFKKFIARGNVLDLAVAVVIGGAFGQIVTSLVNDILMPPIGLLLGGLNFASYFVNLSGTPYATLAEAQEAGAATINYGMFINTILNFLIVALAIFFIIRLANRLQPPPPPPAPQTRPCPYCFTDINKQATRCPSCTSELAAAEA